MDDIEIGNLIYLAVLGGAVVVWFVAQNRNSLGRNLQQAIVWALLFLGVLAAYGLWDDIRGTVLPRQVVMVEAGRIEIPRADDGHYYLSATVNGAPLRFVVDTGATEIVLSRDDARAAGIDPLTLVYTGRANTANGTVATAPVRLATLSVDGIEDRDVRAWVNDGEMDISLLGMRYLERYSSIEIRGGKLILSR